jgi:hypothetical protein
MHAVCSFIVIVFVVTSNQCYDNLPFGVIIGCPEIVFKSMDQEQEGGRKWQVHMKLKCFLLASLWYVDVISGSAGNSYVFS